MVEEDTHGNQERSLQFLQPAQGPDGDRELLQLVIIQVSGMEGRAVIRGAAHQGTSGSLRNGNLALGLATRMGFPVCRLQLPMPGNILLECSYPIPTPQSLGLGAFLTTAEFQRDTLGLWTPGTDSFRKASTG